MKITVILLAILIVGTMSYDDEVNTVKDYCFMVDSGYWPDFDRSIDCSDA